MEEKNLPSEEDDDDFDEEKAVIELLQERHLFLNERKYYCNFRKSLQKATLVLFVNCNDVFSWGCTDAEEINLKDLKELYDLYKKHGHMGPVIWVCKKRNEQPQKPIKKALEDLGLLNEIKDLPENQYDKNIKIKFPNY